MEFPETHEDLSGMKCHGCERCFREGGLMTTTILTESLRKLETLITSSAAPLTSDDYVAAVVATLGAVHDMINIARHALEANSPVETTIPQ
jgi:hypothetical protein